MVVDDDDWSVDIGGGGVQCARAATPCPVCPAVHRRASTNTNTQHNTTQRKRKHKHKRKPTTEPDPRARAAPQADQAGVLVRRVDPCAAVSGRVNAYDILLAFDGVPIANDGTGADEMGEEEGGGRRRGRETGSTSGGKTERASLAARTQQHSAPSPPTPRQTPPSSSHHPSQPHHHSTQHHPNRTVPFRSGERISFSYLVSQKYVGETARLRVLQGGKEAAVTVALRAPSRLVPFHTRGAPPSYFIVAGLVFTPVCVPYLKSEYGAPRCLAFGRTARGQGGGGGVALWGCCCLGGVLDRPPLTPHPPGLHPSSSLIHRHHPAPPPSNHIRHPINPFFSLTLTLINY